MARSKTRLGHFLRDSGKLQFFLTKYHLHSSDTSSFVYFWHYTIIYHSTLLSILIHPIFQSLNAVLISVE